MPPTLVRLGRCFELLKQPCRNLFRKLLFAVFSENPIFRTRLCLSQISVMVARLHRVCRARDLEKLVHGVLGHSRGASSGHLKLSNLRASHSLERLKNLTRRKNIATVHMDAG